MQEIEFAAQLEPHRRMLWALGYRMTGDPAEADDLVQETFARALAHRPGAGPLAPWLTRTAMNLAIDLLRKRKQVGYPGPWLPSPIESEEAASPGSDPSRRYELAESATLAFLIAVEELTPSQRAVLLLRDVFDYSAKETAAVLELSEENVRTTHFRARERMRRYDETRRAPTREEQDRNRAVLERFLAALIENDRSKIEALLTDDVRAVSDGGGRYAASKGPVVGPGRVARLYLKLARLPHGQTLMELRMVNGLPALVMRIFDPSGKVSPLAVLQLEVDDDGMISAIRSMVVPEKVGRVRFPSAT